MDKGKITMLMAGGTALRTSTSTTTRSSLKRKTYKHSGYASFNISDPKPRNIHKAQVRDRILHHAVFQVLNLIFEAGFISASFSCRVGYGTHKGVEFLQNTLRKASKNDKIPCFALNCDIKKFFDTIILYRARTVDKDNLFDFFIMI